VKRLAPLLLALAGCFDSGDYKMCGTTGVGESYPSQQLHNPYTNECFDYSYGGYCDPWCGPCPARDAPPAYGYCLSQCTGLGEDVCLATAGCQASYYDDDSANASPSFTGCWAVARTGPSGGACEGRGALACAEDDRCVAYYSARFERCGTEPTMNGCDGVTCAAGTHCEQQCAGLVGDACTPTCVPDDSACAVVDCQPGYTCVEACDGSTATDGGALVPAMCHAECVPTGGGDPGSCSGPVSCVASPPACPASTVPGIISGCWSGYCIPEADCSPHDPGGCEPASCATPGPACPPGTVGGTANGCWTGYCIPATSCPLAACHQLATEAACTARMDCQAVYAGTACTCDPSCTCEELTFDHCAS
jgi:hypothetical protein